MSQRFLVVCLALSALVTGCKKHCEEVPTRSIFSGGPVIDALDRAKVRLDGKACARAGDGIDAAMVFDGDAVSIGNVIDEEVMKEGWRRIPVMKSDDPLMYGLSYELPSDQPAHLWPMLKLSFTAGKYCKFGAVCMNIL